MRKSISLLEAVLPASMTCLLRADDVQALSARLVTGGCCHDYAGRKDLLKPGLEAQANARF
jgi:hypothetical protein